MQIFVLGVMPNFSERRKAIAIEGYRVVYKDVIYNALLINSIFNSDMHLYLNLLNNKKEE